MISIKDLKNSRDLKKLRDVNGSEYIGKKKKGIKYTMILKRHRLFKNQNNFLTLELSTV